MKALIYITLTLALLLFISTILLGQPGFPGGGVDPVEAPIDGGLGLLAAAGGAYAYKKLRDRKKESEEKEMENIDM